MTLGRPASYLVGVTAALALPLCLGGSRLARLVKQPGQPRGTDGDPAHALRAAFYTLRVLARTGLPWWRNTCLYRALAECLVLRHYGIACRVELGVARSGETIGAHAWVVRGGGEREPASGSLAVLR